MDTPIYDAVLGDRLAAARASVERAQADAAAFSSALDAGQAQALDELARQRAETLAAERTAELTERVQALERRLRMTSDELAAVAAPAAPARAAPARAAPAPAPEPAPAPTPAGSDAAPAVQVRVTARTAPARLIPTAPIPTAPPTPTAAPPVPAAPPDPGPATPGKISRPAARKAADQGPTGVDVPSVPSMKDIFASTRAGGWLDHLLGAKR